MVAVFVPNGISIWFKNCHYDHIPFTVKGNGNIVFSVYVINDVASKLFVCLMINDENVEEAREEIKENPAL